MLCILYPRSIGVVFKKISFIIQKELAVQFISLLLFILMWIIFVVYLFLSFWSFMMQYFQMWHDYFFFSGNDIYVIVECASLVWLIEIYLLFWMRDEISPSLKKSKIIILRFNQWWRFGKSKKKNHIHIHTILFISLNSQPYELYVGVVIEVDRIFSLINWYKCYIRRLKKIKGLQSQIKSFDCNLK